MKHTDNFNLKKPEQTDFYNVEDFNENAEIIDAEIQNRKTEHEADASNIAGLTNPTFDDSGSVEGISSFPDFLTKFKSKVNIFQWFRDFKAGAQFILHAGQIVNNCVTNNAGLPLSAAQGKVLMDLINKQNGDLNPIKSYASNADVVTTIRNLISSGQKYGIILFVGNTTGLPSELPSGNVAYIQPLGTDVIYLEYKWELHRYYGYIAANATAPTWDKYVLISDLGIVIKNSGNVAAVKNSDVQIATITLPANHKYLILAHTQTSSSDENAIMSCSIKKISGTTNSTVGFATSRTTMNNGGGCVSWGVVDTVTSCVYGVRGYGYSSADYNYVGDICAIQLS